MPVFKANDGVSLAFATHGSNGSPPLIMVGDNSHDCNKPLTLR